MKKVFTAFVGLTVLAGCAGVMTDSLKSVRRGFANDDFVAAADKFADNTDIKSQDNLQLLITGLAQFQAKNYKLSDDAFEEFNKRNINTTRGSIMRELKMLMGGRLSTEYKPYMMDSLFVSYYQILDAIGDKRFNDVRVIINQSYARQQDMSRAYSDMVEKSTKKLSSQSSELSDALQQQSAVWAAYTDIMNPALMYLSGIWFLNNGDFSDAETYLKRAYGMSNDNIFVANDLKLATNHEKPKNKTWVFIESGFAPMLKQDTVSLPVLTKDGLILTSIATAKPVFWDGKLTVSGAKPLADVNAMFMTEFNQYNINDTLRAVTASAARAVAQNAAYKSKSEFSFLLGAASTITSVATNNAEVRSWVTLPASISILRLNTANLIDSELSGMIGQDITLPTAGNYLIYVRLTESEPIVHIFKI